MKKIVELSKKYRTQLLCVLALVVGITASAIYFRTVEYNPTNTEEVKIFDSTPVVVEREESPDIDTTVSLDELGNTPKRLQVGKSEESNSKLSGSSKSSRKNTRLQTDKVEDGKTLYVDDDGKVWKVDNEWYNNNIYSVKFNPNGGTVSKSRKTVVYNEKYGYLPTPVRNNCEFKGWYTEPNGGTVITSDSIVSIKNNHTLYARWYNAPDTVVDSTTKNYVSMSIKCDRLVKDADSQLMAYLPLDGVLLPSCKVEIKTGDTVYDVLERCCKAKGIPYEVTADKSYVKSLNNMKEFDSGRWSGWCYYVNGVMPSYPASSVKVNDGDTIVWDYGNYTEFGF